MELIEDLGMVKNASGNSYRVGVYLCKQCSNRYELYTQNVKRRKTDMCSKCSITARNKERATHGMSDTIAYKKWNSMKHRCYNHKYKNYHRWGGRGISVCDEWKNDFFKFKEWFDLNHIDGFELDRRDNDKNYEPSNCRFVSKQTNILNRDV